MRLAVAATVATLTFALTPSSGAAMQPANFAGHGGGHDRWGYIDCFKPGHVVVSAYAIGTIRLAVRDPINGQNFWSPARYSWMHFHSEATIDGDHMVFHAADRNGLDGHAWVKRAFAKCKTVAAP